VGRFEQPRAARKRPPGPTLFITMVLVVQTGPLDEAQVQQNNARGC